MGVRGLQTYIVGEHAKATRLVDLAKEHNLVLLCDLPNFAVTLSKNVFRHLPPSCRFYGGDVKLLMEQCNNFITAMQHLGIKVVFVDDAPFGAIDKDYKAKLFQKKERSKQRLQSIATWHDRDFHRQLTHPLVVEVCSKVVVDRGEELITSYTEADHLIISRCKEKTVFGVLSDDTDFAVGQNCNLILLKEKEGFGLEGFHDGKINTRPMSLQCRYTNRSLLSSSLGISPNQLPHLAVLCGNDYTKEFQLWRELGLSSGGSVVRLLQTAQWLKCKGFVTRKDIIHEIFSWNPSEMLDDITSAYDYSIDMYEGTLHEPEISSNFWRKVQQHQVNPKVLSIENRRYWLEFLPEPLEACGKGHEFASELRCTLYALCDCQSVEESGRIDEHLRVHEKQVTAVAIQSDRPPVHIPTQVALLCHSTAQSVSATCRNGYDKELLVKGTILAATLNYILNHGDLGCKEPMFLLSFAACSLDFTQQSDGKIIKELHKSAGRFDLTKEGVSETVSLSAIVLATLPVVYQMAGVVGLGDLPNMADIYSPAIFVHMMMKFLPDGRAFPSSSQQCQIVLQRALCLSEENVRSLMLHLPKFKESICEAAKSPTIERIRSFIGSFQYVVNFVREALRRAMHIL
jgi:hypothetical protein